MKGDPRGRFANARARHEAQSGLKIVADLLPVERQVPAIVRVRETESARVVPAGDLAVGSLHKQIEGDVLVAAER